MKKIPPTTFMAVCRRSFDKPLIWSFWRSWSIDGFRPYGVLDVDSFKSYRWNLGSINEIIQGAVERELDPKKLVPRLWDWRSDAAWRTWTNLIKMWGIQGKQTWPIIIYQSAVARILRELDVDHQWPTITRDGCNTPDNADQQNC
jgi:hypothetical protein